MADVEEQQKELSQYGIYWESHLQVYKRPLVWLSNVLTTNTNNDLLNLIAVFAVVNCLIMFLAAFPMPLLLLFGIVLLFVSIALSLSILANVSNRFYPNWGENEEDRYKLVCSYIGNVHYKVNGLIKSVFLLRKQDPKKFYGFGILLSFVLSHLGHLMSTSLFLHITIAYHYQLHHHLMSNELVRNLCTKLKLY